MDGMNLIRSQRGLMTKIADSLGISRSAVAMWERVPAERVPDVERITGFSRDRLRPDLWSQITDPDPAAPSPQVPSPDVDAPVREAAA